MFPIHLATMLRMCGASTIPIGAVGSMVKINNLIPAVVGDIDTHNGLGALINILQHNVNIGGIPAIPSIISMASPDILGLIPHPQGLPIPIQGSPNVFIGQGSGAAGLGMMQQLGLGNFASLNIGELVSVGSQVIGMVQNFTQIGGGSAVAQLSNLQGSPIGPGTTVTGQTSGYKFTFSNYIDSRVATGEYTYPAVNTVTNALVQDDGQYIAIDDFYNLSPTQNLTASVITQ
jgi:hypothetical protein